MHTNICSSKINNFRHLLAVLYLRTQPKYLFSDINGRKLPQLSGSTFKPYYITAVYNHYSQNSTLCYNYVSVRIPGIGTIQQYNNTTQSKEIPFLSRKLSENYASYKCQYTQRNSDLNFDSVQHISYSNMPSVTGANYIT